MMNRIHQIAASEPIVEPKKPIKTARLKLVAPARKSANQNEMESNCVENYVQISANKATQKCDELSKNATQKIIGSSKVMQEKTNSNLPTIEEKSLDTIGEKVNEQKATPSLERSDSSHIKINSNEAGCSIRKENVNQMKQSAQNGSTDDKKLVHSPLQLSQSHMKFGDSCQNIKFEELGNKSLYQSSTIRKMEINANTGGSDIGPKMDHIEKDIPTPNIKEIQKNEEQKMLEINEVISEETTNPNLLIKERSLNTVNQKEDESNQATSSSQTNEYLNQKKSQNGHSKTKNLDDKQMHFPETTLHNSCQNSNIKKSINDSSFQSSAVKRMESNSHIAGSDIAQKAKGYGNVEMIEKHIKEPTHHQSTTGSIIKERIEGINPEEPTQNQLTVETSVQTHLTKPTTAGKTQHPYMLAESQKTSRKHDELIVENFSKSETSVNDLSQNVHIVSSNNSCKHNGASILSFKTTASSSDQKVNVQTGSKVDVAHHSYYAGNAVNIVERNRIVLRADKSYSSITSERPCSVANTMFCKTTSYKSTPMRNESKPMQQHGIYPYKNKNTCYNSTPLQLCSPSRWDEDYAVSYKKPVSAYDARISSVPSLYSSPYYNLRLEPAPQTMHPNMHRPGFFEPAPQLSRREMFTFCLKCQEKTYTKDYYRTLTVKGQPIMKGYCVVCDRKKCCFLKRSENYDLF